MRDLALRIYNWLFARSLYVICDARDNSVTFSERLCKHMRLFKLGSAKVFAFALPDTRNFAFTINPELEVETQLADVQYNSKHRTIGFESLNPTVNMMFYNYGLSHDTPAMLSVRVQRAPGGLIYYEILRP